MKSGSFEGEKTLLVFGWSVYENETLKPERSSGVHVVATTNSLFETTDESCPLISGIPTVLLIDPCKNCASFWHKNGRNWHFSGFLAW